MSSVVTPAPNRGVSPWLTYSEVAKYLKVSVRTVANLIPKGLPVVYIAPRVPRVRVDDLEQWLNDQREQQLTKKDSIQ